MPSFDDLVIRELITGAQIALTASQIVEPATVLLCKIALVDQPVCAVVGNYSQWPRSPRRMDSPSRSQTWYQPEYLSATFCSRIDAALADTQRLGDELFGDASKDNCCELSHIPLAPLPEQRRIVAEIEKQFTRLDAGVAALKRVQANLKRYRASVLKAACEGRLAPQDPADEPADRLLARILAERRAKWEAEHPGKKYVEPAAPVTDGLPELPEGWCWARWTSMIGDLPKRLDSIGSAITSRRSHLHSAQTV